MVLFSTCPIGRYPYQETVLYWKKEQHRSESTSDTEIPVGGVGGGGLRYRGGGGGGGWRAHTLVIKIKKYPISTDF